MNFKIGATSDTYPNNLITNVHGLKKIVNCVQLNLFQSKDLSLLPTKNDIENLKKISEECGIQYTIHLPLDINICANNYEFRKKSLQKVLHIYELTKNINPHGYIIHLERINITDEENWIDNTFNSLDKLYCNIPKNKLLIENISSYKSKLIHPILDFYSSFICLDINHAERAEENWEDIYKKYQKKIKVIHFYGAETKNGHEGLQKASKKFISKVIDILIATNYNESLILELFNEMDFFESKKIFEQEISNHYRKSLQKVG